MPHVPDGTLRRLADEPLAVADRDRAHLSSCRHCRARRARADSDAAVARQLLAAPAALAEPGDHEAAAAWQRSRSQPAQLGPRAQRGRPGQFRSNAADLAWRPPRHWRLMGTSAGAGLAAAGVGAAVAGVAAAATLTTIFSPTKVAPVPVTESDAQELAGLFGIKDPSSLVAMAQRAGTETLPFGKLSWTTSGRAQEVGSLSAAATATGLALHLPSTVPAGVGAPEGYYTLPVVTATFTMGPGSGDLTGSSLVVTLGPGAATIYGSAPGGPTTDPTLALVTLAKPVATSSGATAGQIENYLLSQPAIPADIAAELRVLGDLQSTLPVPVPAGADWSTTTVDGAPAVVLSDGSGALSAAVWEDSGGRVQLLVGLVSGSDLLSVARQIG